MKIGTQGLKRNQMKLIFPNGEHEAFALADGINSIGNAPDCNVILVATEIAPRHCEIEFRANQATIRILDSMAVTTLNGRPITQIETLKAGDLLSIGKISCRLVAIERTASVAASKPPPIDEDGHTRVRTALPKFVLRGVSGVTFGKTYALAGTMTMGRTNECDITVPAEEVSRSHVRLQVTSDGIMVEDLGSANGTWINNQRVHTGLIKAGDELRLDTIRFMLIAPGMDVRQQVAAASQNDLKKSASFNPSMAIWAVAGLGSIGLIIFVVLRYLGKI